ncbi:hypothetical protein CHLRE_10g467150v5 [Chlamydomonas reinhardtii]|uniref:Uncharacterized protein n=1 Tax=Chlamydomonas reinhardtii TaxID=3055 RepID=A0A2K3DCC5_CHLRE|nr:uncharacterized protein CHLRE_10g467150v5 [Chlamydomonas reinhardtii]PNW78178.1 hypothetical protein CHLRE_10g467150v5 [Chlamydomonas reinhardtii]
MALGGVLYRQAATGSGSGFKVHGQAVSLNSPGTSPLLPLLVLGSTGLVQVSAAWTGLGACHWHLPWLLNVQLGLLALLLASQMCITAAVVSASEAKAGIGRVAGLPHAPSSGREVLFDALRSHWGPGIAVVAVEVTTLLVACLLHAMYIRADEAAEEAEELGATRQGDASAPLLTPRRNEHMATSGQRTGIASQPTRHASQRV